VGVWLPSLIVIEYIAFSACLVPFFHTSADPSWLFVDQTRTVYSSSYLYL